MNRRATSTALATNSGRAGVEGAFTLVEILVSIAVLVLIVVLVSQLINTATKTVTGSRKHMDADTQARLIFNRMAVDFANMIQRPDLDYSSFKQPSSVLPAQYNSGTIPANTQAGASGNAANDQLAFYAKGVGYFSGGTTPPAATSRASLDLVAYYMDVDTYVYGGNSGGQRAVLQRLGKGLGWETDSSASPASFLNIAYLPSTITGGGVNGVNSQWPFLFNTASMSNKDGNWDTVGDQVFRLEYNYLLKPNYSNPSSPQPAQLSNTPWWDSTTVHAGSNNMMPGTSPHTCVNGFQDVAAIVVAIGVLDSTSSVVVSNSNTALASALPDAVESSSDATYHGDIQSRWQAIINSGSFAKTAGIPQEAASSVRVYQRYFYLSSHQ